MKRKPTRKLIYDRAHAAALKEVTATIPLDRETALSIARSAWYCGYWAGRRDAKEKSRGK